MSKPAHKNVDFPAGQILSPPLNEGRRKLTFEEWFQSKLVIQSNFDWYTLKLRESHLRECWKAAQENAPSSRPGAREEKQWYEPREDV